MKESLHSWYVCVCGGVCVHECHSKYLTVAGGERGGNVVSSSDAAFEMTMFSLESWIF